MSLNLILGILAVLFVALLVFTVYGFFARLGHRDSNVYKEAMDMAESGNFIDARGLLRKCLDQNPSDFSAHYYMSRIYSIEGNAEQELYHLTELKRINILPKDVDPIAVFSRAAYLHYENNNLGGVFDTFLAILELEPENETALAHLAFLAIGQEEFSIAEKYFSSLVEVSGKVKEYHLARGVGLSMLKRDKSLESFEEALKIDPEDHTTIILKGLECLRQQKGQEGYDSLSKIIENVENEHILYIIHKLSTVFCYLEKNYSKALDHAVICEKTSKVNNWITENHDSLLSIALMAILCDNLPKAAEALLELEMASPTDEKIIALSDFRVDLADERAELNQLSPRGFNFVAQMRDWMNTRFSEDTIYSLSSLKQNEKFKPAQFLTKEEEPRYIEKKESSGVGNLDLIDQFNDLGKQDFENTCQKIIGILGFKNIRNLKYREPDGEDYIGESVHDSKSKALFRIRKWSNQPISDIFLREQQSFMNEQRADLGFVIASTQLTEGAEKVLKNLRRITVINQEELARILKQTL